MISLIISAICFVAYVFMAGYSERDRTAWVCASLMAFNWLLSEIVIYGIRHP